jgi:hypothetical protein
MGTRVERLGMDLMCGWWSIFVWLDKLFVRVITVQDFLHIVDVYGPIAGR